AHRGHANAAKLVDRANDVPNELVGIPARLLQNLVVCRRNPASEMVDIEPVNRIARNDLDTAPGGLRIEACGAVSAAQDSRAELRAGQIEHPLIFLERSTPRHNVTQREHRSTA